MKKLGTLLVLFLSVIALVACASGKKDAASGQKLKVVATNSIIADITKNIAGDKIDLHSIVPIGQDPHEYEPLPEDVKKTSEADLIFYNGINLETGGNAWFSKLVENAKKTENKDYFAVSEGVDVIYLEGKNEKGKEDPHAWLNLENGIIFAKNIAKQLSAKDPNNKEFYEKNLKEYTDKLDKLDKESKDKFNNIPAEKKLIVTSEGAFKYFSKAYGVPSAYIWEINTEEEGTPDQIKTLVEKLRQTKTPSLFVESSVDDRPMKTVSQDTNIPIYAQIFTDSIAEQGKEGDSYYNMMKYNLDKIDLHSIVPVGQDPHEYEPLPEDVKKTSQADLIFYNGINLETGGNAWFTKLVENAKKTENKDYFAVSDGVDIIYLEGQNEKGKEDPHAWLNLENGIIYAKNIAKQLIAKDPSNKEFYEKNLKDYTEKLDKLDKEAKEKFNNIPAEKKLIVTSEGCFKYFSKAYGVPSAYIWEINTEEEGTPEQIKTLVEKLRQTKVPSLFVESSVDDRPMKTVSQDTNIPIYAQIFTDSIAEEGKEGDSYYSMMKYNLDKIAEGLSK